MKSSHFGSIELDADSCVTLVVPVTDLALRSAYRNISSTPLSFLSSVTHLPHCRTTMATSSHLTSEQIATRLTAIDTEIGNLLDQRHQVKQLRKQEDERIEFQQKKLALERGAQDQQFNKLRRGLMKEQFVGIWQPASLIQLTSAAIGAGHGNRGHKRSRMRG